jgi:23S rRNA (cytosine1962-C5)-methyltransferase
MKSIRLREGKERSLLRRHPWVFEGSIARGKADPGETGARGSSRRPLPGLGRVQPDIDPSACAPGALTKPSASTLLLHRRCSGHRLRARLGIASDGVRLVHGEADGLPGLIVDRYGDTLSAQFGSAGIERWRDVIADALLADTGCTACTNAATPACARWKACPSAPAGCGRRPHRHHHHRARLAADAWTWPWATRPASTWTSATTATRFAQLVRQLGCRAC